MRAHPHAVPIVAAGPLTDIALALGVAPDLAGLAKPLVFMGGLIDTGMGRATGNADCNSDCNFLFDPEAAHIVLSAPWARVTATGSVVTGIVMTPKLVEWINRAGTPVSGSVARFARHGQPLWDEIVTAVAVDPSLIRQDMVAFMDVDLQPGPDHGCVVLRRQNAGSAGGTPVHVVQFIDETRFEDGLVAAAR